MAELNALDTELYEFAKTLLFERFQRIKTKDANFEERFNNLGNLASKTGVTEFNWDRNLDDSNYNNEANSKWKFIPEIRGEILSSDIEFNDKWKTNT